MTFAIPTLQDLVQRSRTAFRSYLPGSDAWLFPNNIGPTAKVIGGHTSEVFGYADYIARQKFALTADGENLDRHGEELGLARRPASPATGTVVFTSTGELTVASGAVLARSDGVQFYAGAGGTLPAAGTMILPVLSFDAARATNTLGDTPLVAVSGVTGAATVAVAAEGIVGGADVEEDGPPFTGDLGTYRGRILFRKRYTPMGGAPSDYVIWAGQVPGVTRVFVERRAAGPGTVRVFPLMDDFYADGIPPAAAIAAIQAHLAPLQPAGALVVVAAPTRVPVPVTVSDLVPATTPVHEAVRAELRGAFRRLSRVAGSDQVVQSLPFLATPFSFSRSWIWQAVANATGEERHAIVAPPGDILLTAGQLPTLGAVTFV